MIEVVSGVVPSAVSAMSAGNAWSVPAETGAVLPRHHRRRGEGDRRRDPGVLRREGDREAVAPLQGLAAIGVLPRSCRTMTSTSALAGALTLKWMSMARGFADGR